MVKKVQICNDGYKQNCTFDYNLSPHAKNNNFYYNMGHIWSKY